MKRIIARSSIVRCTWADEEEVQNIVSSLYESGDKCESYYWKKKNYLLREVYPEYDQFVGVQVLELIYARQKMKLRNSLEFAKTTDCEWVYVVDLDEMKLETYCNHENIQALDDMSQLLGKDALVKLVKVDDITSVQDAREYVHDMVELAGLDEEEAKDDLEEDIECFCQMPVYGEEEFDYEAELKRAESVFDLIWEEE